MASILQGELAGIINDALIDASITYDLTLKRSVAGAAPVNAYDPPALGDDAEYTCQGFVDRYSVKLVTAGVVRANDRKVMVLAPSLSVTPVPGDRIETPDGEYTVVNVDTDPAGALWELQSRR